MTLLVQWALMPLAASRTVLALDPAMSATATVEVWTGNAHA